jgi:hypothetical protein
MTNEYPAVPDLVPLIGLSFVAPLVIWLIKRDEDAFVEYHSREALNFQLTLIIYFIASVLLMFVLIGFLLILVVGVFAFVAMIVAGVKAAGGEFFRYPLNIRFVKG